MPPRDPRLCPALERALPGDLIPGSTRSDGSGEPWRIRFGDGEWRDVSIRGWARDVAGRDVADVEWSAAGGLWSETYAIDLEKMRRRAD